MQPYTTDTSVEADAIQLELLRRMSPSDRITKMCNLSASLRRMAFDASDASIQISTKPRSG